jgi:hypothetical protein
MPQCFCNGHSESCDQQGYCTFCLHHTAGPQCDYCEEGYEGDPRDGGKCFERATTSRETTTGSQRCFCNGHSESCDQQGYCTYCLHHTTGAQCDYCEEGYEGDPRNGGKCFERTTTTTRRQTTTNLKKCFCNGLTESCERSGFLFYNRIVADFRNPNELWTIQDITTRKEVQISETKSSDSLELIAKQSDFLNPNLFFSVSKKFTGQKILSYGGEIRFSLALDAKPIKPLILIIAVRKILISINFD